MNDMKGEPLLVGDKVVVAFIDTDRGAQAWMGEGTVVGFGRSRVKIQFPSRVSSLSVGSECLRRLGGLK